MAGNALPRGQGFKTATGDALIVVALSTCVALAFNALRQDGIPLVTYEPPAVLVPCPDPGGDATGLAAAEVAWGDRHDLVIDARDAGEYAAWHAPGARNVVYDFLDPVSDEVVSDLVAIGSFRVVVYGDGSSSDTGKQLAGELTSRGVRNVFFVEGGAPAVEARLAGTDGGAP